MAREIVPSEQTINTANGAPLPGGQARDLKAFDKYVADNVFVKEEVLM